MLYVVEGLLLGGGVLFEKREKGKRGEDGWEERQKRTRTGLGLT